MTKALLKSYLITMIGAAVVDGDYDVTESNSILDQLYSFKEFKGIEPSVISENLSIATTEICEAIESGNHDEFIEKHISTAVSIYDDPGTLISRVFMVIKADGVLEFSEIEYLYKVAHFAGLSRETIDLLISENSL